MKFGFKKKLKEANTISEPVDYNLTDVVKDIIGGLQNALNRGSNLEVAMQSFANAGYDVNSIMTAANYVNGTDSSNIQVESGEVPNNINLKNKYSKKKIMGLKPIIFLVVLGLSIIFLVGALILGLNWNNIF